MTIGGIAAKAKALAEYVKQRLDERSTLMAICGSVSAAAVLPTPWCYISIAIGVVAALVPDGSVRK